MIPEGEIRLRLTLQYDGTRYYGWQVQPNHATVQGELERVVQRLTGSRRPVIGSGRTDRGVHALGQVASVDLPSHWTPDRFCRACNALLPEDVWLVDAALAVPDFHPRYDAVARTYLYRIGTAPHARSPFVAPFCWPLSAGVDIAAVRQATEPLLGRHGFQAFAKSGQPERGYECVIQAADWEEQAGELRFRIRADRYLHHMVRYIVGTLIAIGRGHRPVADLTSLLQGAPAGAPDLVTSPPAPATGLFLAHVAYPGDPPPASVTGVDHSLFVNALNSFSQSSERPE